VPSRTRRTQYAVTATLLLVLGVLLLGLYRVSSGTENHAYSSSPDAPTSFKLTAGEEYHLSVPGGVEALKKRAADVTTAQCEWSINGSATQALVVSAEGEDTKATNVVGSFVSPFTGALHIDCVGWGPVFVDDADNTKPDYALGFLIAATIVLTLGVALAMSAGWQAMQARAESGPTSEDDEVQRFVDVDVVDGADVEIVSGDRGDVGS